MKKIKLMIVVGTRPELIRLSMIIIKINNSDAYECILVHTGQNYDYELNEIFFKDLKLPKPKYFLDAAGPNGIITLGKILISIDPIIDKENPDAFLILGDTNSCLCAIAAKKKQVPVFHFEAGNRCFDDRVPEEINRRIVDHISDINLTYSSISREYLLREGISPDKIIKLGSPMYEVLSNNKDQIDKSNILSKLKLSKGCYFLVSSHREENINTANFLKLVKVLNGIALKFNYRIIFSTHPRTKAMIENENVILNDLIELHKPFGFIDYNKLQINAKCVLSDSGTISEESSIVNFPAINIRDAHERPEAMEEGAVIMTGLNLDRVLQALSVIDGQNIEENKKVNIVKDYDVNNVSDKVIRVITSYIDYVNHTTYSR
tara:strand:- start:279 stop:1409 length:1131 start_codon:yes stop_codon:yes gene_type:complete